MAEDSLETQLRRLAAIVAPLAETVNQHDERLAALDAIHTDLRTYIEELRDFNAKQVTINERLETLMTRALRQEPNGRDA